VLIIYSPCCCHCNQAAFRYAAIDVREGNLLLLLPLHKAAFRYAAINIREGATVPLRLHPWCNRLLLLAALHLLSECCSLGFLQPERCTWNCFQEQC
jgi:hypothetical protein